MISALKQRPILVTALSSLPSFAFTTKFFLSKNRPRRCGRQTREAVISKHDPVNDYSMACIAYVLSRYKWFEQV